MSDDRSTRATIEPSGAGPGGAYLLVIGRGSSSLRPLPARGGLTIGRAPECELRLEDGAASRRHSALAIMDGEVLLRDLGSHNGTLVNGERLAAPRRLASGDVITIGDTLLVLHCDAAPGGAAGEGPGGGAGDEGAGGATQLALGDRSILVADPAMTRLFALIRRLAPSDLPVLVSGETGAGKENAAYAVHAWSRRAAGPFVPINCAAIPDNLVESELFGYEKGAFSGAAAPKPGLLESAASGTVFLDELGELPLPVQAKLLRVLETRRVTRLGALREREVDLRVVAATHRDLEAEVRAGRFREDLFFRLGAATVVLPPLRDRPRELPLLARAFLDGACARLGRRPLSLSPALLRFLPRYRWPGNVRELKNAMEFAAAAAEGDQAEIEHLPPRIAGARELAVAARPSARQGTPPAPTSGDGDGGDGRSFRPLSEELQELERRRVAEAYEAAGYVQTRAAELIGMPLRTFIVKLKQYGITPPEGHRRSRPQ